MKRIKKVLCAAILAALSLGLLFEHPFDEKNIELTELRAGYDFNLVSYSSLDVTKFDKATLKALTNMVNITKDMARFGLENAAKKAMEQKTLQEAAQKTEEVPKAAEPAKEAELPIGQTIKVDRRSDVLTESLNGSFDGFATEMLKQLNEYRIANGLAELKLSSICVQAANVRVQEQAISFSHTRPGGTRFLTVYDDIGYGDIFDIKGENLQKHSDASYDIDTASLVTEAIENFKLSESHNALMLSGNYEYVGFAVYFPGDGIIFIAQEYGNP